MSDVNGIGLGPEASYGEDVTATKWLPAVNVNWDYKRNHDFTDTISAHGQKYGTVGLVAVTGSFEIVARADDLGEVLFAILGAVGTVDNTGSYTHTFTTAGTCQGYTFSIVDGLTPNIMETMPGWFPTEVKLVGKAGGKIVVSVSWEAQTVNLDARGSPSFSADPALTMLTAADFYKVDTVADSHLNSFDVTLKREYASLDLEGVIGSILRPAATPGMLRADGTIHRKFKDLLRVKDTLGGVAATEPATLPDEQAIQMISVSETVIAGAFYYTLEVNFDEALFEGRSSSQSAQDLQFEDITLTVQDDGTSDWVEIKITNAVVSYPTT